MRPALSSTNKGHCGHFGQAVLILESAYWMEKQARACILYIFSLGASLLAAEQKTYQPDQGVARRSECGPAERAGWWCLRCSWSARLSPLLF